MTDINETTESAENSEETYTFESRVDLSALKKAVDQIRNEISKIIVGQRETVDLLITALLSDGHVLLEGVPGIAKTLIARIIAKTIGVDFGRIQFTPDLMPSDVLGTSVFNPKTTDFDFKKGPIFSNIVLIDEINRSPAKTQAALFEVMEERQVSMDGVTYKLDAPFLILATQNPIDHEGTYSLPEAQTDRFLFKIIMNYPDQDQEYEILKLKNTQKDHVDTNNIETVISAEDLNDYRDSVHKVHAEDKLLKYIAEIVCATRNHDSLYLGASPRASAAMLISSKAFAAVNGRDFITPDDIKFTAVHVLNHRVTVTPEKEMEGIDEINIIRGILQKIEVPR